MASRFWVGGTGTWDASTTTNWSATSGGAGGASVPTSADDVLFDTNSGTGTVTATITLAILTLDCTGYSGTLIHQSLPLTLTGSLYKLSATMTYTPTTINFSPSFGVTMLVTTAGKTLAGFTAGGSGTIQLQDALQCAAFTQNSGTFDTQSFNLNCTGFTSSNASTRVLTFGSSQITCSGAWTCSTTTNLTVNAGTSTINLTGTSQNFNWGSGFTFNNLVGTGSTSLTITGAHTFNNFTRTGTAAKTDTLVFASNITVTGTFTVNGNSTVNRVLVQSNTGGTARTVTAATVSVSNADFMDMTGAGAGSWNLAAITGLSGDCGGNSGITFTTSATQYRVGTSSTATTYSDSTHWASTSGGVGGTGRVPLPQDDVVFDNSTPLGVPFNIATTWDMPRVGRTIDWTAYNTGGSVGGPASTSISVFGSWLQGTVVFNASPSVGITFAGRGSYTVSPNNTFNNSVGVNAPGGTYTLAKNLNSGSNFVLTAGTVDAFTNNVTITCSTFNGNSSITRAISGGTWVLTNTTATTVWNSGSTALTVTNAPSITISTASVNTRTLTMGNSATWGALTYTVAASTGILSIAGSPNTWSAWNFSDASGVRTVKPVASAVNTVGAWNVNGTAGNLLVLVSGTAGTATIFRPTAGATTPFSSDYLSLQDTTVQSSGGGSGTGLWYAGANSTNVSNNTGWIFTAPPSGQDSSFGELMLMGVGN